MTLVPSPDWEVRGLNRDSEGPRVDTFGNEDRELSVTHPVLLGVVRSISEYGH